MMAKKLHANPITTGDIKKRNLPEVSCLFKGQVPVPMTQNICK